MKTLILCRHAKSDWPIGVGDMYRPLKERGVNDANFLAGLLKDQGFCPDKILSSPAKRAMDTAEIASSVLEVNDQVEIIPSIYHEGAAELIRLIRGLDDSLNSVMIFGHNPTMENTVSHLLNMSASFEMPTSAMASLEMRGWHWKDFSTRNVHLRWLLVPRLKRIDG